MHLILKNDLCDLIKDCTILFLDGGGYVEDGREIFDEQLDGDDEAGEKKGSKKEKKSKNPNIRPTGSKPKTVKSMFAAVAVKSKPKAEVIIEVV